MSSLIVTFYLDCINDNLIYCTLHCICSNYTTLEVSKRSKLSIKIRKDPAEDCTQTEDNVECSL